jgi:hypothetical protein
VIRVEGQKLDEFSAALHNGADFPAHPNRIQTLFVPAHSALDQFPANPFVAIDRIPLHLCQFAAAMKDGQLLLFFQGKPVFLKGGIIQVEPDGHRRILALALQFRRHRAEVRFSPGMRCRPFESTVQTRPHFWCVQPKFVVRDYLRRFDGPHTFGNLFNRHSPARVLFAE